MSVGDTTSSIGFVPTVGYPAWTAETAPASPSEGDIWFKPSTHVTSFFVSGAWEASAGGGGGATLPAANAAGDILMADATKSWVSGGTIDMGNY